MRNKQTIVALCTVAAVPGFFIVFLFSLLGQSPLVSLTKLKLEDFDSTLSIVLGTNYFSHTVYAQSAPTYQNSESFDMVLQ
jgi:hypothetical protein